MAYSLYNETGDIEMIGTTFKIGNTEYIIDRIEQIDAALKNVINMMQETGKDTAMYFASKKLKSGKQSVQSGMFYRFIKTGQFIKVL